MSSKVEITAIHSTLLKKKPIPGSELNEDEISSINKGDIQRIVWSGDSIDGHTKISLADEAGNWYVYNAHWDGLPVIEEEMNGITPKKLDTPYFSQRDNFRISGVEIKSKFKFSVPRFIFMNDISTGI